MKTRIDKFLISISIAFVLIIVGLLYFNPETSLKVANAIFSTMTNWFGSMTLVFTFFGFLLLVGVALSKYGKIKLGDTEPEHSTLNGIHDDCGLGSATIYWAFISGHYIGTPGLGIEPFLRAFEMAVPYTCFTGVSAPGPSTPSLAHVLPFLYSQK